MNSVPKARKAEFVAAAHASLLMLANRSCRLDPYAARPVPAITYSGDLTLYASPDSTFAVTQRALASATKSILIGIYDFSSTEVKTLVLEAMRRRVEVSLMLDVDSGAETLLMKELAQHGAECVVAPSCSSKQANFFASSHEKVIVIDDELVLVQSGNYSKNSAPKNGDGKVVGKFVPGNRDTGIALRSKPLASFFTKILRADMKLQLDAETAPTRGMVAPDVLTASTLLAKKPAKVPKLVPSKRLAVRDVSITPVLTPDNYMDTIPEWLASAQESILIEQQYIRTNQPGIRSLLDAMSRAKRDHPALRVRIIVANAMTPDDRPKLQREMNDLTNRGFEVRLLNPEFFVHCHNKMIVRDGKEVLVSSQNWSDSAVLKNREAGLLVRHKGAADYFAKIFEADWKTALKKLPGGAPAGLMARAALGMDVIQVELADVQEV